MLAYPYTSSSDTFNVHSRTLYNSRSSGSTSGSYRTQPQPHAYTHSSSTPNTPLLRSVLSGAVTVTEVRLGTRAFRASTMGDSNDTADGSKGENGNGSTHAATTTTATTTTKGSTEPSSTKKKTSGGISFSLGSTKRPTAKRKREEEDEGAEADLIVSISGGKIDSTATRAAKVARRNAAEAEKVIIPLQASSWKATASPAVAAAVAATATATTTTTTTATTTTASSADGTGGGDTEMTEASGGGSGESGGTDAVAEAILEDARRLAAGETDDDPPLSILVSNQIPGLNEMPNEKAKLQHDVEHRPDVADLDAYRRMPVHKFGEALLRGQGWEKGKRLGRNETGLLEPVEYVPRTGRRGLGAAAGAAAPPPHRKRNRPKKIGETDEPRQEMVLAPDADGRVRNVKSISEKLVAAAPTKPAPGVRVVVARGKHESLAGLVRFIDEDVATVRLDVSEEDVLVQVDDLELEHAVKERERVAKAQAKAARAREDRRDSRKGGSSSKSRRDDGDRDRDSGRGGGGGGGGSSRKAGKSAGRSEKSKSSGKSQKEMRDSQWILPRIRVRIVSKRSFAKGKYYNKKGSIVDVTALHSCIVRLDSGAVVDNVPQSALETVLPKSKGARVTVVRGEHRFATGTLVERDSKAASVIVKLEPDFEIVQLSFDDVAESA